MSDINRVTLTGRLGKDPDVFTFQSGDKKASFSLASNKFYKGGEQTEWHTIIAMKKAAELAESYLHKGDRILVEGELRYNKFTDRQSGIERTVTEIVVWEGRGLTILSRPGGNGEDLPSDD